MPVVLSCIAQGSRLLSTRDTASNIDSEKPGAQRDASDSNSLRVSCNADAFVVPEIDANKIINDLKTRLTNVLALIPGIEN